MKNFLMCTLFYWIARLFYTSYRFRYMGLENLAKARSFHPEGSFCLASWHENALAGVLGQIGYPYCFLISPSQDGEYVDFLSRKFGYKTVRGSSSRGGKEARENLEFMIKTGYSGAFTVDGPRGPRRQCKPGVLITAYKAGTVILPVAAITKKPWVLSKTWDQTKIPKPFAKIVYQLGPPIKIPKNLDKEKFDIMLQKINRALNATEEKAIKNLQSWNAGVKQFPFKKKKITTQTQ